MTRPQYIESFSGGDPAVYAAERDAGRFALPCGCDDEWCVGWQLVDPNDLAAVDELREAGRSL